MVIHTKDHRKHLEIDEEDAKAIIKRNLNLSIREAVVVQKEEYLKFDQRVLTHQKFARFFQQRAVYHLEEATKLERQRGEQLSQVEEQLEQLEEGPAY